MQNIEDKLNFVANILLKEKFVDFKTLVLEQIKLDPLTFLTRNKDVLEVLIDIDEELESPSKLPEILLFLCIAIKNKLIFTADWSGEEYPGQIKRGITNTLKQKNIPPIKWRNKNISKDILSMNPNRGEYIPLLCQKLNEELQTKKLSIGFIDAGDDQFYFFVLPNDDFNKVINIQGCDFIVLDTKIYELYLTKVGKNAAKIMLYIKNKFNVPLANIKIFMQQDKILITTGNMATINSEKDKIEKLGAETKIVNVDITAPLNSLPLSINNYL